MSHRVDRVPTWLEQSANAPGVEPKAIELHNRMNGALERCDVVAAVWLMRELGHRVGGWLFSGYL